MDAADGADEVPRGVGRTGGVMQEGSKKINKINSSSKTEKWGETLAA